MTIYCKHCSAEATLTDAPEGTALTCSTCGIPGTVVQLTPRSAYRYARYIGDGKHEARTYSVGDRLINPRSHIDERFTVYAVTADHVFTRNEYSRELGVMPARFYDSWPIIVAPVAEQEAEELDEGERARLLDEERAGRQIDALDMIGLDPWGHVK